MKQKLEIVILNPRRAFIQFSQQLNVDISKEISLEQFQLLFLRLVDAYLKKKLNLEEFFQFMAELDFTPFFDSFPEPKMDIDPRTPSNSLEISTEEGSFTLPEIIEFFSDTSSYETILKNEPTLKLVDDTNLSSEDYPPDWPMLEILRYYKKNRNLLD